MSLHEAAQLMPAGAIYYNMDEQDVRRVMRYPVTMIGPDGLPTRCRIRVYGALSGCLAITAVMSSCFR